MKLILALSSFLLFMHPLPMLADAVVGVDATTFGNIISFDSSEITVSPGCSSANAVKIAWSAVLLLQFDKQCKPHIVAPETAGLERCEKPRISGFKIRVNGSAKPFFVTKISLTEDGVTKMVSMTDEALVTGQRAKLNSIEPTDVCPSDLPKEQHLSGDFCSDPKQMAVDWSPTPVFSNQVFTRGSSIYINVFGPLSSLSEEDIRFAYQTALSLWAIALQDGKATLDDDVRRYVESSTSRSASFSLFTPPQVLRMVCPGNALAVIDWYAERRDVFPLNRSRYVAMAQVQGRTVLLNANDNRFAVSHTYGSVSNEQVNLITVFVHELGHSFGLPDRPHSPQPSVMDVEYVADNLDKLIKPTEVDLRAFAAVLKADIAGSKPGVFNISKCAGLQRSHS